MFPTFSSLLEYVFGISTSLPIPTFGVFVALAFILSYLTFLSEFKRKEQEGVIKAFSKVEVIGGSPTFAEYFEYGFLGFLLGFKVIGAFVYKEAFLRSPLRFIFSFQGSWIAALVLSVILLYLIYWLKKQERLEPPVRKEMVFHPYQLMPKLMIWTAVWGFLGAKVFNFLEHIQLYSNGSINDFLQNSGLTFLGGLTFGALTYLYIGYKNGMRLIDLADIGSPGMLVAYGVGRIGCQLSGDGDWGIVNQLAKPVAWLPDWMWSFRFPHNVLNKGIYLNGCSGEYCAILPQGVFPTSFYESVIILGCFSIIWINRRSIRVPGIMFSLYLLVIGLERFFIEEIRVNFKYNLWGWRLSEAQIVSLVFVLMGIAIVCTVLIKRKRQLAK